MQEAFEDRKWLDMTLKEFTQKHVFGEKNVNRDEEKGVKLMQELPENFKEEASENAKQLDKHMIWVSGGALALISTIFSSDRFVVACYTDWIVAAMVGFGICLLCVVSSFRAEAEVLRRMPKLNEITDKLFKFMHSVKENDDMDSAWKEAEKKWKKLTGTVRWGYRFISITGFLNNVAYLSFVVGMISFLVFGIIGLHSSKNCMEDHPKKNVPVQGGGERVEKSSQASGQMFQEVVSSIPSAISDSGALTDNTDTGAIIPSSENDKEQ